MIPGERKCTQHARVGTGLQEFGVLRLVLKGRRVHRIKRKSIVGQCVLVMIALQIMLLSSFVSLTLPTATGHNLLNYGRVQVQSLVAVTPQLWQTRINRALPELNKPVNKLRYDAYTPEAPVAFLLGYVFGFPIATIAVAIFAVSGLVGPLFGVYLFASGGGLDYWNQPGFGYILGMIAASLVVAKITKGPRTSLRQSLGLVAGVITLHLFGIVYVLGCSLGCAFFDAGVGGPNWLPWVFEQIRNLSWYAMPYDAIFGLVLIGLGFPLRSLVGMLTAPDIELKSRADVKAQRQIEEILQY
jgi:biotin transporter BioY